mmetsp:Transcript_6537/g.13689  ORF Transcript_6537/g.13689 Transcript_6537/m.13689 type:complete len:212 (-) Transcript_6537:443-1078(-)
MVVRYNCYGLDSGRHKKIDKHALHLGLPALKIVSCDENLTLLREFDDSRHEGILRRPIDKSAALLQRCDSETGGSGYLRLVPPNGSKKIVGGVVDPLLHGGETFRVGRPEHDDLVERVFFFKVADVLSDLVSLFLFRSGQDIVRAFGLVCCDKVRKVHGGERFDLLEVGVELLLEVHVQDLGTFHGVTQVHGRDVPPTPLDLIRIDHGEHV